MSDLTKRQALFVREYLVDLSAEQAARRAGYSPRSAKVEGYRLLRHPGVAAAIARERKQLAVRTGVTPERVLTELAKLGFSDIRKAVRWRGVVTEIGENEDGETELRVANEVVLVDSDKIDDDTAAAITEISQTKDGALKVKLVDKRQALVDIGRHLGMFKSGAAPSDESGDEAPKPQKSSGDDAWDGLLQ
ncbi:terminase small subunit [Hansschlegelia sp.]|uniref:terminase small subunit n=1 Tax=Hansschlegelia sp. TaxID=2041892 RepID=UPI002BBFD7D9|nr:terminase small subunit [Hansschlegelia sp.]HVI27517.1 terminase small subunit [Hansschlegelia sp.]